MFKTLLYTLLMGIFIIGCAGEVLEEEPIEEVAPPPPTPEEVAEKIINDLQLMTPLPPPGTTIPPEIIAKMKTSLQGEKARLSATEDGKRALAIVSQRVDSRARQCFNNQLWPFVLAISDMHIILNPGSKKFDIERNRAVAELSRPIIVIKGILNDGATNRPLARLEITLPLENRTVTESMKQGEQLYGVRFVEVIGHSQGIVFKYLETDDLFEVLTKAASR
jgi:hypothetical protein